MSDISGSKGIFAAPSGAGLHFRNARRRKAAELTNAFAERLAEHGDIKRASYEIGVNWRRGRGLFRCICDRLGWQAQ
jgi:hypothetical protein